LFALLKDVENIIGESYEDLGWAKFFALWCYFFMTISLIPKSNKSLTIPFHADIFK